MRRAWHGLWALALAACAGTAGPSGVGGSATGQPAPPPREEPLRAECTGKVWIQTPPPEDAANLYFVGLSTRQGTEQGARDAALRHATSQFVAYTGVEVSIVDQVLTQGQALASQIQDPRITTQKREELRSEAFVSRVKGREYCTDAWRGGDLQSGGAYQTAVLVAVPKDEYERVQQAARARRQFLLGEAQRLYETARDDERQGRIVAALGSTTEAGRRLEEAAKVSTRNPGPAPVFGPADLRTLEQRALGGLILQAVGAARLEVPPGNTPPDLAVRARYRAERGEVPVAGLPLLFLGEPAGQPAAILAQGQTGPGGEATLPMHAMAKEGAVTFRVRVDQSSLQGKVSETAQDALARLQVEFLVSVKAVSLDEKAAELVVGLAEKLPRNSYAVVVGNFFYEDAEEAGMAGKFGSRFQDLVETRLAAGGQIRKAERKSLLGQTRSIGGLDASSPATLARAAQADAVLYGKYYEEGDAVVVKGRLDDLNARQIAAALVRVAKSAIPDGWTLKPDNYDRQNADLAQVAAAKPAADFKLDLWIDRGAGATYRKGEKLFVNLRSGADCYLKLVYLDAAGHRTVIFPNAFERQGRMRAGQVYQIPDARAGFAFEITLPFGAETLFAFASTELFPPDKGREIGNGMVLLEDSIGAIARNYRALTVKGKRAEARVTLTTVGR